MKQVIFWQDMPSMHQSALIRNFAKLHQYQTTLVLAEDISSHRLSMGWDKPDFGRARVIIRPKHEKIVNLINSFENDKIHIFSGFRSHPFIREVFISSLKGKAKIGVLAESPNPNGINGFIRKLLYIYESINYKRRLNFILAIGEIGVNWYKSCGYSNNIIYPFAYFVEQPVSLGKNFYEVKKKNSCIEVFFIGELSNRKGVDLLLRAASSLLKYNWRIQIIGDGPELENLKEISNRNELTKRVTFWGAMKNEESMHFLENADLLILPSRFDGWGAVVSEAIMRGIPVLCSSKCGASSILDGNKLGEVFSAFSVDSLKSAMEKWLVKGKLSQSRKEEIKRWSENATNGKTGANYLHEIIESLNDKKLRPAVPWDQTNQ